MATRRLIGRTCRHNGNKILVGARITGTRLFRGLRPEKVAPAAQLKTRGLRQHRQFIVDLYALSA